MISADVGRIRAHVSIVSFQLHWNGHKQGSNSTCIVNFNLYSWSVLQTTKREGALIECRIIFEKWQCHAIIFGNNNNNKSETDCKCERWKAKRYTVCRGACKWQTLEFRLGSNAPTLSNAWCHKVVLWVNACIVQLIVSACDGRQFAFCIWCVTAIVKLSPHTHTQLMNSCTAWANDARISIR